MRTRYIEDLANIRKMEKNVSELIKLSYDRFKLYIENGQKNNLEEIIDLDHDIRQYAADIERFCYDLLALQQPVARDLRFLQMSIKLASTYKRVSNHIAQAAAILLEFPLRDEEKDYVDAFIKNQKLMNENGIKSFENNDNELALRTIEDDEINNELFEDCIHYLVKLTKQDQISPMELSEKVLFYKYFERLGDRLAKVADYTTRL
ncbi:phosphate uptake regulator PhoU [Anaerococcus sp. AGMB00486]|uniref:Phosphate uptake regulator PhoU n=1 Tax=Anaerococcus faecalis TaxID=2742993 RepID=A0ABX2N8K3_9FIRM|nr:MULTISPECIES: PhoU domain-containing protein [Anaerococcus]MDY3005402.1 PhoU domain-containing protein [Anaerococcus porci]NVF10889.1 phosphate uptake regulator PhoU [Anaerococcus faecalis]